MILFVPAYDEPTRSNLAIAERLTGAPNDLRLFAEDATESNLRRSLSRLDDGATAPLFAMSHGTKQALRAQGGDAALSEDDLSSLGLLAPRPVFAFACHTATVLGRAAASQGVIWWGYTGAIQSPVAEEPFRDLFVPIFDLLCVAFSCAATYEERRELLEQLHRRCRSAERAVDDALEADPAVDPSEALLCLLHLWDRLRIWVPGNDAPECHPAAKPPSLM